jgi:hypothetical protein
VPDADEPGGIKFSEDDRDDQEAGKKDAFSVFFVKMYHSQNISA